MSLTSRQRARNAEKALDALELSVTTNADRQRISQVWSGLRALDEEQMSAKGRVTEIIAALGTGYTATEAIEDLRGLIKEWEAAAVGLASPAKRKAARQ